MLYIPIYVVVPIRIHQDSKTSIQPCTAYMPWHMNQNTGYSVQRIMYDKSIPLVRKTYTQVPTENAYKLFDR